MIRLRSQKLLSGVSTLAMLASFGVVGPALAAATYPGPLTYDPITNDQSGAASTVLIGPDATVRADATTNDSFYNTLTMTGAGAKLTVSDSYLLGDIENTGTMASSDDDGIFIGLDSQIGGRIFNSGLIQGVGQGIEITDDSTVAGGILNSGGTITGTVDGILLDNDSEIFGGITNSGLISGSSDGIDIQGAGTEFFGGITNTGTIRTSGGSVTDAAIEIQNGIFSGGITNSGYIGAPTGVGTGIWISSTTFSGNITNNSGGVIEGLGVGAFAGISITAGNLTGNIVNSGSIRGSATTDTNAIDVTGGTITGEIQNNAGGVIAANGAGATAILVGGGTITGGIDNSGQILATGAGGQGIVVSSGLLTGGIDNQTTTALIQADATAILISIATFTGNVSNTGTIDSNAADAILITSTTFTGDITSSGLIEANNTGIEYENAAGTFTGNITNSTGGVINAGSDGIDVEALAFNGNVTNAGTIGDDSVNDGIELDVVTFTGNVTNSGRIGNTGTAYVSADGMDIDGTTLTGSILNSGSIYAQDDGIIVNSGLAVSGSVTNTGTIFADANNGGGGTGIDIDGTVAGVLNNTGLISAEGTAGATAIDVSGTVTGGITNSGSILGSTKAIDLSGADTATTITQTAGLIRGRNAAAITTALDMVNTFNDTFNGNGGTLDGNVLADAGDDFVMAPSGTFAYLRGTASGLDTFNMTGSGTAVLGSSDVATDGEGVTVGAVSMTFGGEGTVHIDEDTDINLTGNYIQTDGLLQFHIKTNVASGNVGATQYGDIISTAGNIAQGGNIGVYIDAGSFAATPVTGPLNYENVLDGVTSSGAFINATTITTSSIFFTGAVETDGVGDVDIALTRLDFADALAAAGATESTNQDSVATALETIYTGAAYGSEFEALFAALFGAGLTPEEIQAQLDDVAGAEHAQNQQMGLNITGQFNDFLGMRLDETLGSSMGMGMAALRGQQYADAATTATDGSTSARGGSHGLNRGPSGVSVWLRGFGQWVNVDADPNASGYDQDTSGAAGGIDYAVANNATVGVAGSWSKTESEFDTFGDSSEIDSWAAGAYGSVGLGRFYVDGLASYTSHDVSAIRTVTVPNVAPPPLTSTFLASSAYDATAWSVQAEVGMLFGLGRVNLQPSAGLSYSDLTTDAFRESADVPYDVYALIVDEASAESFASTLALRASGEWKMGRTRVMPEIRVGWRHEFENDPHSFTAAFSEDPLTQFTIISSELQQDSAVVRAGATFGVTRNIEVFVNLNGQYSSDAAATNASGGLRLTW